MEKTSVNWFGSAWLGTRTPLSRLRTAKRPSGERAVIVPILILQDSKPPGLSEFETARHRKVDGKTAAIPIIMRTARGDDADVVTGLEIGAATM